MSRRRIELEKGAIRPLNRAQWDRAKEKLHEAEHGLNEMKNASTRQEYEAGWTRFVDSLEEFWVRLLKEGKEAFRSFQPWAGKIISKRKSDELLQYFYQARHQSQHGVVALNWEEQKLQIAPGFSGHIKSLRLFEDGTYQMDATPLHPSVPEPKVVHSPGKPLLPTIENRKHGQSFKPPGHHKGNAIGSLSPIDAAQHALIYYKDVIQRAEAKFMSVKEKSDA